MFQNVPQTRSVSSASLGLGRAFRLWTQLLCAALILAGCHQRSKANESAATSEAPRAPATGGQVPLDPLVKVDVRVGTGAEAVPGKKAYILYNGTLKDGTSFDARRERHNPFVFIVGDGTMIDGLEQGIRGMKVGGIRRLTVPPHLGYGARAVGKLIPPNSTLIFEIELLKVD